MGTEYITQKLNKSFVRRVCDVPVLHVAVNKERRAAQAAARASACRAQCLRYVLDQLVHGGRGRRRFPQWRAGPRLGMGVRRTSVLVYGRLRDIAARRARARRPVSLQAKRPRRVHGLQRGRGAAARRGARQTVPRGPLPSHEQQLQPLLVGLLSGAVQPRHPVVGEPARVRLLVRALPAALSAQGVADAGRAPPVAGGALAGLLAADAAIAPRSPALVQLNKFKQSCVLLLNRCKLGKRLAHCRPRRDTDARPYKHTHT